MPSPLLVFLALGASSARLVTLDTDVPFPEAGQSVTKDFGEIDPGMDFDEAIVSWNVDNPAVSAVKVEAVATQNGIKTKPFILADWAYNPALHPRVSVNKQGDESGTVLTDTLHLKSPAQKLNLSLVLQKLADGETPRLKLVTVCFANTKADQPVVDPVTVPPTAWGKDLMVPQRAQNNYPNGGVLCSATSVSMLLWHYSNLLNRPELNQDVPAVQAGVWDTEYKGAGNWPFNTAFAGSFPGMRGYVARFNGVVDLEKWIDLGLPVACSVSFDMLRGKPLGPDESGHLIVLTGFTKTGDPVVNDPAFKDAVHKSYPRADFIKAWDYSHRTVYLIYPETYKTPEDPDHLWFDK